MSERYDHYKIQTRGFDLTIFRNTTYERLVNSGLDWMRQMKYMAQLKYMISGELIFRMCDLMHFANWQESSAHCVISD